MRITFRPAMAIGRQRCQRIRLHIHPIPGACRSKFFAKQDKLRRPIENAKLGSVELLVNKEDHIEDIFY
jgi:hypothetical protein